MFDPVSEMFPEITRICGVAVVSTPREVDISNSEALRDAIAELSMDGAIVVALQGTRYIDASGLTVLVQEHNRRLALEKRLLIVLPRPLPIEFSKLPNWIGISRAFENRPMRFWPPAGFHTSRSRLQGKSLHRRPTSLGIKCWSDSAVPCGLRAQNKKPDPLRNPAYPGVEPGTSPN